MLSKILAHVSNEVTAKSFFSRTVSTLKITFRKESTVSLNCLLEHCCSAVLHPRTFRLEIFFPDLSSRFLSLDNLFSPF